MFNTETVVHLIGDPCLKLYHKGKGRWCFEFDDHGLVGTKMVLVNRLNDLPLDTWVNEGRTFAAACGPSASCDGRSQGPAAQRAPLARPGYSPETGLPWWSL
jgi:hypothetical protein